MRERAVGLNLFGGQPAGGRLQAVDELLQACTACGLCNAVCPTFVDAADERESPRGRIAMMRHVAARERAGAPSGAMAEAAGVLQTHLDRCTTCLACMPACPEGVDFGRALDLMRGFIGGAHHARRRGRVVDMAGSRMTDPIRLRRLLRLARWARPLQRLGRRSISRDAADVLRDRAAQVHIWEGEFQGPGVAKTRKERKARVMLLPGCAQKVLRPGITDAAIRLLGRGGIDVVVPPGVSCCGAIDAQLGRNDVADDHADAIGRAFAKANKDEPVDFIVTTAAACGSRVKRVAAGDDGAGYGSVVRDLSELLDEIDIGPPVRWFSLRVGYLGACSLRASGVSDDRVAALLARSGFTVRPLNPELACCGGLGAYPIVAPDRANSLRTRMVADIARAGVDLVVVHDIGCLTHLTNHAAAPVAHLAELLDWAFGGPIPSGLEGLQGACQDVPKPRKRGPDEGGAHELSVGEIGIRTQPVTGSFRS